MLNRRTLLLHLSVTETLLTSLSTGETYLPVSFVPTLNKLLTECRRGQNLSFYCEVPSILAELKHRRIHVAAASRTSAPELAKEALGMLLLPANEGGDHVKAISYFNTVSTNYSYSSHGNLRVLSASRRWKFTLVSCPVLNIIEQQTDEYSPHRLET